MKKQLNAAITHHSLESDLNILTKAVESTSNGVVITDNTQPDNPIIYCNKAFEIISGYSRSEIIGRNCRFLQQDDRDQEARKILRDAITQGKSCLVELRNYKKDGTLFWNELIMSPVKNDEDEITHFVGIQNDITRRKEAELQLKKEREQLSHKIGEHEDEIKSKENFQKGIVDTVRESLLVLDKEFKVISANRYFYNKFKVSEEETIGENLYELGNGQWDIPALRLLLEKILPEQNPFENFEVHHNFPHIGTKVMLLNAREIELDNNRKQIILLAIEDITASKDLQNRKDDFLSIASHELKTPITSIKSYMHVLNLISKNDSFDIHKVREIIGKVDVSVSKLELLINDLLDVSKIQSGKMEYNFEDFNFDEMVRESIELVQSGTKTHTIALTGTTKGFIHGDKERLEMVVNNLLLNAIKYSPDSHTVNVHISKVSDFLKVSVTDSGIGIKKEDQNKLFERFFRVQDSQKKFAGMGIGLYVCDQIIKRHNGTLWVDSEMGKGATFSFTIPLKQ